VADLAAMLNKMGAHVRGAGTSHLEIEGTEELMAVEHRVIPDRVVVATYLAAVGIAGGDIVIDDARPEHMEMLLHKLGSMGLILEHTLRACAPRAADSRTRPTWRPCPTRGWRRTTSRSS